MMNSLSPLALVWINTGLLLWLLPCALQDRRYHRISNWLTVPLFVIAWPAALLLGTHIMTLAVFVGVWMAFHSPSATAASRNLGGADGKIAVGLAALSPLGLIISVAIQGLAFLYCRLRKQRNVVLPGAVGFFGGVWAASIYLSWLVLVME